MKSFCITPSSFFFKNPFFFLFLLSGFPFQAAAQTIRYVMKTETGNGTGSSWENASKDLQRMIYESEAGDEVWIAKGTYYPDRYVLIPGISITVPLFTGDLTFSIKPGVKIHGGFAGNETSKDQRVSQDNETILSGNVGEKGKDDDNSYHTVTVLGVGEGTLLEGVTITDGNADNDNSLDLPGIPVLSPGSTTLLRNRGGGIYIIYSPSFTLRNVKVVSNKANEGGGGVYIESSTVLLENITIEENTARSLDKPRYGGGLANFNSTVTMRDSRIRLNTGANFGGGIFNQSSDFNLSNSEISNNGVGGSEPNGGGIYDFRTKDKTVRLDRVKIIGNRGAMEGGGLFAFESGIQVTNSVVARNSVYLWDKGSGIAYYDCDATLINNTIVDNRVYPEGTGGSGVVNLDGSKPPPLIRNCLIWGNGPADYIGWYHTGNSNNYINQLASEHYDFTLADFVVNPFPTDNSEPDYSLSPTSPAINTGANNLLPGLSGDTKDLAGNQRVYQFGAGGRIDIGAYEYQGDPVLRPDANGIVYVVKGLHGNGSSWKNAVGEVSVALKLAKTNSNVKQVWVAKGTYYPLYGAGMTPDGRHNTFLLAEGVSLYGGFKGTETSLSQRTGILTGNKTILSGDIGVRDQKSDNSYHVVTAVGINRAVPFSESPVFDGFVVEQGNADGDGQTFIPGFGGEQYGVNEGFGGGFFIHTSLIDIQNVSFESNSAQHGGGALYSLTARQKVSGVAFTGNRADKNGGAVSASGTLDISGCSFASNEAGEDGGALNADQNAVLTIDACTFSGNIASAGGAVRIGENATASFSNSNFSDNQARTDGGAVAAKAGSKPSFAFCDFKSNTADRNGGAVASSGSAGLTISRSSFNTNSGGQYGGAVYFSDHAAGQQIANSVFVYNRAVYGGAVAATGSSSVRVVNTTLVENKAITAGGQGGALYYDGSSGDLVANSILWGNLLPDAAGNQTDTQIFKEAGAGVLSFGRNTVEKMANGFLNISDWENIGADPLFLDMANPMGVDNKWSTADDGLQLTANSPALNMGDNTLVPGPATMDFAGKPRIFESQNGGRVDMGAYEWQQRTTIRYVRAGATGRGTSWLDAAGDIQPLIDDPVTRKILVAKGTYHVTGSGIALRKNLEVYGGYSDTGLPAIDDRNWLANETILHGSNERCVLNTTFGWEQTYTPSTVVDGFTITGGNSTMGGGIYNRGGAAKYRNLKIFSNAATSGAGIFDRESVASYENIRIQGNSASSIGGGLNLTSSNATLTAVLVTGNTALISGGLYISGGKPVLRSATVSGNASASGGSGLELEFNALPLVVNTIVWGNTGAPDFESSSGAGFDPAGSHNFIRGAASWNGEEEIEVTSFFAGPVAASAGNPQTGGDYSLKQYSPAVNKGLNSAYPNLDASSVDMAGNPRVYQYQTGGIIDVGAFEFQQDYIAPPETRYVKQGASGSGLSWTDPSGDIQAMIGQYGVKQVWVAKGTYTAPSGGIKLKRGVAVYGGFADSGNPAFNARNWTIHTTTVDGGGQGSVIYNKYSAASPLPSSAILDGFVITGGNAQNGGGIYNEYASPTLTNLHIRNNNAEYGGGLYNANSSPDIRDVKITGNTASIRGGGMYNSQSDFTFLNAELKDNSVSGSGGGMHNVRSTVVMKNVSITGNQATYQGGGIGSELSDITLKEVSVSGNKSDNNGGGIYVYSGNALLVNVLVSGNTTGSSTFSSGGGIYNSRTTSFKLVNCTVSGNYSGQWAGMHNNESIPEIYNTVIWGNNFYPFWATSSPVSDFGGTLQGNSKNNYIRGVESQNGNVNYTAANFFVTPVQADASTANASGNYRLPASSPAVNGGVNAFYTNAGGSLTDSDLAGIARIYNQATGGVIDIGCYEFHGTPTPLPGIRYVRAGATGNGTSWNAASGDIQAMINAAGVQQVWVAKGTYYPAGDGLTLKNSVAVYGGFPASGNPVFANRDWRENEAILDGQDERIVIHNVFTNDTQLNNTAILDGFTITRGKGISTEARGSNSAGGIHNIYASPVLSNLLIKGNWGETVGGVFNSASAPVFRNTVITGNFGYSAGGMSNNTGGSPKLFNVLIAGNTGGGLAVGGMSNWYHSSPELTNVTISGNSGGTLVSQGIYNDSNSTTAIFNSIVWGNGNTAFPNNVTSGSSHNFIEGLDNQNGTSGYAAADFFVNPILAVRPTPVTEGDYRLKDGSPAINKGDNTLYPGLSGSTLDLNGLVRVYNYSNNGKIDAGAYEFQGEALSPDANGILFVRKNAAGNGSSWTNALGELADALKFAKTESKVKQVWVARGTYKPAYSPADQNFGNEAGRDNAFLLPKDVKVYGGFAGDETSVDARDLSITQNASILSGDLDPAGIENDARHVVIATGNVGASRLDGFTVTGGNASESANSLTVNNLAVAGNFGGGIYMRDITAKGSPVLANIRVEGNRAVGGGGIYLNTASPQLQNFNILGNTAVSNGGGMYSTAASAPELTSGYIDGNSAGANGGGMYNASSDPELSLVSVRGNSAGNNGGGINNASGSVAVLRNSLVTGNKAASSGGGMYSNNGSRALIYSSTFAGNNAASGGALYVIQNNAGIEMYNSIVYGNSSGVVRGSGAAASVISSCIVQGGATADGNAIDTDPGYMSDPGFAAAPFTGGSYRLRAGSIAVNRGDQKTNSPGYAIQAGENDLDGNLRIANYRIDLGPYESECTITPAPGNTQTSVVLSAGENYVFNACSLLAIIQPTGDETLVNSLFTARSWENPDVVDFGNSRFVRRYFELKPQAQGTATAVVTLFFTAADFEAYNNSFTNGIQKPLPVQPGDDVSYLFISQFSGNIDANGLPEQGAGNMTQVSPSAVIWNTGLKLWQVTFPVSGFSGFYITTGETALPVTLTRFEAGMLETGVELKWQTSSESGFRHFEVERSIDARNFEIIGKVAANEGNAPAKNYNMIDNPPVTRRTIFYYRLRMVDSDGTYQYSEMKSVALGIAGEQRDAMVYPNPAYTESVKLEVYEGKADAVSLVDLYGRKVEIPVRIAPDGTAELRVGSLTAGTYILQIRSAGQIISKKLVIAR